MVTLTQLIARVDAQLPNTVEAGRKAAYLADALRRLSPYLGARRKHEWRTTAGVQEYTLPQECSYDAVISIETRVGDGAPWQVYGPCRAKERARGYAYYDAGMSSDGAPAIGLCPIPQGELDARVYYTACPEIDAAQPDGALAIPAGACEALVMYACAMLCSTGGAPDVQLGNLYRRHYSDALLRFSEGVSRGRAAQPVRRENPWW